MSRRIAKDWRPFLKAAERAGWRIREGRGKGGFLLYPANGGPPIPLPQTPSPGKRALDNKRSELRRAGLAL